VSAAMAIRPEALSFCDVFISLLSAESGWPGPGV
jgi:hypothetical protein